MLIVTVFGLVITSSSGIRGNESAQSITPVSSGPPEPITPVSSGPPEPITPVSSGPPEPITPVSSGPPEPIMSGMTFHHRRGSVKGIHALVNPHMAGGGGPTAGSKRRLSTRPSVDVQDENIYRPDMMTGKVHGGFVGPTVTMKSKSNITEKRRQSMTRAAMAEKGNLEQERRPSVLQNAKRQRKGSTVYDDIAKKMESRRYKADNVFVKDMNVGVGAANRVLQAKKKPLRRHSSIDETWDMGKLAEAVEDLVSKPPDGITDIDSRSTDPLALTVYASDVTRYLKGLEHKFRLHPHFLKNSPAVSTDTRAILMDWLIEIQRYLRLHHETLHLAVTMIDHCLQRCRVTLVNLQLVGITCLFVACKYLERFTPSIQKLVKLTDDSYKPENVIIVERKILRALEFKLYMPTPCDFLDRLQQVVQLSSDSKLVNLANYLLDLGLLDSTLVPYPASIKAASTMCFALKIVARDAESSECTKLGEAVWTRDLAYYSTYNEADLDKCMQKYASLLLQAGSKSKFQGARNKYSSKSRFGAISLWPELSTSPVIKEIALEESM